MQKDLAELVKSWIREDSMKIAVTTQVEVYELNGEETSVLHRPTIAVKNHNISDNQVVLSIGDKSYTVAAEHLEKAIKNATNQPY